MTAREAVERVGNLSRELATALRAAEPVVLPPVTLTLAGTVVSLRGLCGGRCSSTDQPGLERLLTVVPDIELIDIGHFPTPGVSPGCRLSVSARDHECPVLAACCLAAACLGGYSAEQELATTRAVRMACANGFSGYFW